MLFSDLESSRINLTTHESVKSSFNKLAEARLVNFMLFSDLESSGIPNLFLKLSQLTLQTVY
jgi:hypothetical protein